MASSINASTSGGGGVIVSSDATGNLDIQSGGSTVVAVSSTGMAVTGTLSASNGISVANTFGFKNRIINGGMVIDQRNASVTSSAFTVDRFAYTAVQTGKATVAQSTTAPTGFIKSIGVTSSSAYTVLTGDYFALQQPIEGLNMADLAWGTASASAVTLSFQVYSSLTGTFGGSLLNGSANRSYPFSYSIPVANTWTAISITIAGDTTGTWATDTAVGVYVFFGLGAGATYSGTAGSWSASSYRSATGATSVVGTNGATFYITGVQLEKGSTATSFDFRAYSTELAMCQRYYQTYSDRANTKGNYYSATAAKVSGSLSSVMRSAPTGTLTGNSYEYVGVGAVTGTNGAVTTSVTGYYFDFTSASGGATFAQAMYLGTVALSAEL